MKKRPWGSCSFVKFCSLLILGYVEGFTGNGFTAIGVTYTAFALTNWFAPLGPDHVQVNWNDKSIGNISQLKTRPLIGWSSNSEAWFPINLCFQLTYASNWLAHDPDLTIKVTMVTTSWLETSNNNGSVVSYDGKKPAKFKWCVKYSPIHDRLNTSPGSLWSSCVT